MRLTPAEVHALAAWLDVQRQATRSPADRMAAALAENARAAAAVWLDRAMRGGDPPPKRLWMDPAGAHRAARQAVTVEGGRH